MLLNLKAELLKKQQEIREKKRLPQHKIENHKPPPSKPKEEESMKEKKTFRDSLQAVDIEELEAYKKTRAMLEKKAELYEHLSNPVGKSELTSRFLVDFDSKKQQESSSETPDDVTGTVDRTEIDDESEWTEFTDCLGRTRKCLKTDMKLFQQRNEELLRSIDKEKGTEHLGDDIGTEETKKSEKPFLVQKTNDYLQTLREKWEEKEKELLAKDRDIHYQDVLFDEARQHGVGYYAFSTDENERHRQMEELLARREETLRAQAAAELQRKQREDLVAARLKAARARQRLRAGMPAEDPEENQKDFNTYLLEFLNKQKEEAEARAKEEDRKIKEQIEKERQKLRESYVREWDRGKEGVEDKVKPFREISQEEYVEQQRDKRINEFAPVQSTSSHKSKYTFDDQGRMLPEEQTRSKTWSEVRPKVRTPSPPNISEFLAEQQELKGLYFSSKSNQKAQGTVKYKNFVKTQEPVPIENELSDEEADTVAQSKSRKRKHDLEHAEIPPPPTYDYYGPVPKASRSRKPFESDMREAYAQGAKSLETKPSNRHLSSQYDFSLE